MGSIASSQRAREEQITQVWAECWELLAHLDRPLLLHIPFRYSILFLRIGFTFHMTYACLLVSSRLLMLLFVFSLNFCGPLS